MFRGILKEGDDNFEQLLQTQLTMPKQLLTKDFAVNAVVYFNLDSSGKAVSLKFEQNYNNLLERELKRMFNFFRFRHTIDLPGEERPYFLRFDLNYSKYTNYIKQKYRYVPKKVLPSDSSSVIYTKADKACEYYKNGEEGFNEYILSNIEYPAVAKQRGIQGTVIIQFIVETNGYVTGMKVLQGVNGGCSEEALRLLKITRWQPAVLNGKFVRYQTSMPFSFFLGDNNGGKVRTTEAFGN